MMRVHFAAFCAFAAFPAFGADISVVPGQSIQAAIQSAVNGDRILLQPGTYFQHSIDLLGKGIELIGVGGAAVTILDGGNAVAANILCAAGEPETTVIAGITMRNCLVGIYLETSAKPTIRSCVIEDHHVLGLRGLAPEAGDGIYAAFTTKNVTVVDCVIRNNEGSGVEGGVNLRRCTISGNQQSGYFGGGFGANGALRECRITGNFGTQGGGIHVWDNDPFNPTLSQVIDRCVITDNTATDGGGIWGNGTQGLHITNSRIANNHASGQGGGVYFKASNPQKTWSFASSIVRNCVVVDNTAVYGAGVLVSAIAFSTPATGLALLDRCTLSGNSPDGAVFGGITKQVTNCIVWNQPNAISSANPVAVTFSNIEGGFPGIGNFNLDPQFVDAANGDYHLRSTSPCIDVGNGTNTTDYEGDATNGVLDVGGDEFVPHVSLTGDTAPGGNVRLSLHGAPGASPVLFFISTLRLEPGVATPYGLFGLGFPLIPGFPIDFGVMPGSSAIAIPTAIPLNAPVGVSLHMQAFLGAPVSRLTNVESFVIG